MENDRKEKFEAQEQLIFKKNKTISTMLCRISVVVSLMIFLAESIYVWKTSDKVDIYWCFIFMAMFGIVIGPWMACEFFYRKYCFEMETMGNEMQEFMTEEHKWKRCDEIYNAVGLTLFIGAVLMLVVVFAVSRQFPEIVSYEYRMKSQS